MFIDFMIFSCLLCINIVILNVCIVLFYHHYHVVIGCGLSTFIKAIFDLIDLILIWLKSRNMCKKFGRFFMKLLGGFGTVLSDYCAVYI